MKKVLVCALLFLLCLSFVGLAGCGDNRRVVEDEYISFTLDDGFGYDFVDADPDVSTLEFPLGNQWRIVIWDKDYPHNWLIFVYYPCPPDVFDLMGDVSRRTVNGVEVLSSEIEGFNLQAFLDPVMYVGVSSMTDETYAAEAERIVESLKVKKSSE